MPIRFGLCQELFGDRPWPEQCQAIAKFGYEGVEIAPFSFNADVRQISGARREQVRREAEQAGLEVIGLHWLLAKTTGLHLTSSDRRTREATSAYLRELAECCREMGGKLLVLGSPAQRTREEGMSREEAKAMAIDVLRGALETCAACDVTIALEPLTPKETDFLNTCAEARRIINEIDDPRVRLHQDVKAMIGGEAQPVPEVIREFADETVHFHANDTNLLGPGMGETDFAPIFAALCESGYDGFVSVEVFDYAPGAERIAQTSLATMRAALGAAETG